MRRPSRGRRIPGGPPHARVPSPGGPRLRGPGGRGVPRLPQQQGDRRHHELAGVTEEVPVGLVDAVDVASGVGHFSTGSGSGSGTGTGTGTGWGWGRCAASGSGSVDEPFVELFVARGSAVISGQFLRVGPFPCRWVRPFPRRAVGGWGRPGGRPSACRAPSGTRPVPRTPDRCSRPGRTRPRSPSCRRRPRPLRSRRGRR